MRNKGEEKQFWDCMEVELSPEDIASWSFSLTFEGDFHRKNGNFRKALENLNKALKLDPNYEYALACRGELYLSQGKFSQALEDLNRAIQSNPNYPLPFFYRGELHRQMGKFSEALEDLNKVLAFKPHHHTGIKLHPSVCNSQSNIPQGVNSLHEVNPYKLVSASALASRGEIYQQQGKFNEAFRDLSMSLKFEPKNYPALISLGNLYLQLRCLQEALQFFKKANQIKPTSETELKNAEICKLLGNYNASILHEYDAYALQLKERKIPSLQTVCKWAFFKNEVTIYQKGNIMRLKVEAKKIKEVFQANNINPGTLATMRKKYNPSFYNTPTVFHQFNLMDDDNQEYGTSTTSSISK